LAISNWKWKQLPYVDRLLSTGPQDVHHDYDDGNDDDDDDDIAQFFVQSANGQFTCTDTQIQRYRYIFKNTDTDTVMQMC